MAHPTIIAEILVVALFCGSMACWLLKLDDTLPLTLGAGASGVYLEPWMSMTVGPEIFQHSVLACLAGAVAVAFVVGIMQSMAEVWMRYARA